MFQVTMADKDCQLHVMVDWRCHCSAFRQAWLVQLWSYLISVWYSFVFLHDINTVSCTDLGISYNRSISEAPLCLIQIFLQATEVWRDQVL